VILGEKNLDAFIAAANACENRSIVFSNSINTTASLFRAFEQNQINQNC